MSSALGATPDGSAASRPPRVAVLWTRSSGYFRASLDALADRGAEVVVFHQASSAEAPFDRRSLVRGLATFEWSGEPDEALIDDVLSELDPDVLLVSSWHIGPYRRTAGRWRGRTLRVLCMDNQWWGTARQWVGVASARWLIRPNYDAVLLPGDRQADFARRLGFRTEQIMWGLYTGRVAPFEQVAMDRRGALPPRAFLFVGRLVLEKGVDVLVEAYSRYRATVEEPWPLIVAGTGPQADLLTRVEGIESLGFVQPDDLPGVFARAGCLVLPSRFEPWAVVIHEATCAELPVICTWVCGASTRLVIGDHNGVIVSPGDPAALAHALERVSRASDGTRRAMGEASGALAQQYSPRRWADSLLRRVPELRAGAGLPVPSWQLGTAVPGNG